MLDTPRSVVAWEYWLPTPFTSFPFTSPPTHHRVPSGSEQSLPSVIDEQMTVVYQWNDNAWGKVVYLEKNLPQNLFVTCKFNVDWPVGSNPGLHISGMKLMGKLACSEKDLSRCQFVTPKFHVDCTGIEARPLYRGVVEYQRKLPCGRMTRLYCFGIKRYSLVFIPNFQKLTSRDMGPHSSAVLLISEGLCRYTVTLVRTIVYRLFLFSPASNYWKCMHCAGWWRVLLGCACVLLGVCRASADCWFQCCPLLVCLSLVVASVTTAPRIIWCRWCIHPRGGTLCQVLPPTWNVRTVTFKMRWNTHYHACSLESSL